MVFAIADVKGLDGGQALVFFIPTLKKWVNSSLRCSF